MNEVVIINKEQFIGLSRDVVKRIIEYARKDVPNETCGYLVGTGHIVDRVIPMTNADHSPESFHFVPEEQFAALKTTSAMKQILVGVYHSHLTTPARPSTTDIAQAYDPNFIYVIVSLLSNPPEMKAFFIRDGLKVEIPLKIEDKLPSLNLRGVKCPINFLKVKLFLEKVEPGHVVEVFLDDGEPIMNVPRSLKGEGHEILGIEPVQDFYRVLIKNKSN